MFALPDEDVGPAGVKSRVIWFIHPAKALIESLVNSLWQSHTQFIHNNSRELDNSYQSHNFNPKYSASHYS